LFDKISINPSQELLATIKISVDLPFGDLMMSLRKLLQTQTFISKQKRKAITTITRLERVNL
jgi:hypothetical protein